MNLTGQVAIVTGGGRGLGRAYALALADAGAAVAVTARTESEIQEVAQAIVQRGGRAMAVPVDVTDDKAVMQMVAAVEQQLGPVNLLVNNAGVAREVGLLAEVDMDSWWRDIEINLRGPFLCCRAVLPSMMAGKGGRIINLASGASLRSFPALSGYCIAKTGLIRMTESLALENGKHGIVAFAIHPGTVRTSLTTYMTDSTFVNQHALGIQQMFQNIFTEGKDTPIERSVELILQLASGKADGLSGRFIDVNDNLDELIRRAEEIQAKDLYTLRLRTSAEA